MSLIDLRAEIVYIGEMNFELTTIVVIFLMVATIFIFFWMLKTEKRLKRFFMGTKAKDLEQTIELLTKDIRTLETAKLATEKELALINQKLKQSIRGLELIRFNPFPDQGGNQSFAIGMLNEEGDGIVLSSLYSRERMSVFAKPVKKGTSVYELTKEEQEVLDQAKI